MSNNTSIALNAFLADLGRAIAVHFKEQEEAKQ